MNTQEPNTSAAEPMKQHFASQQGISHESRKGESTMEEHEIAIVLNGTGKKVPKGKYTYEQIFDMAFPGQPIPPGWEQPITFSLPHQHHEGSLLPGDSIELRNRMVINVRSSIQS